MMIIHTNRIQQPQFAGYIAAYENGYYADECIELNVVRLLIILHRFVPCWSCIDSLVTVCCHSS
jgi:hypothetical protein